MSELRVPPGQLATPQFARRRAYFRLKCAIETCLWVFEDLIDLARVLFRQRRK